MDKPLDNIHHVAIQVRDIDESVRWYQEKFHCQVTYQDATWALLQFNNIALALVVREQHPYHFAVVQSSISQYGTPVQHRDGTSSVYISDPDNNTVEMLALPPIETGK